MTFSLLHRNAAKNCFLLNYMTCVVHGIPVSIAWLKWSADRSFSPFDEPKRNRFGTAAQLFGDSASPFEFPNMESVPYRRILSKLLGHACYNDYATIFLFYYFICIFFYSVHPQNSEQSIRKL